MGQRKKKIKKAKKDILKITNKVQPNQTAEQQLENLNNIFKKLSNL
jgi:hypothetical protein